MLPKPETTGKGGGGVLVEGLGHIWGLQGV